MVTATLEFEKATPSYPEVTTLLATNLKTDEKLVAIKHIYNFFGSKKAEVIAYVYADENKKQFIEPKLKVNDLCRARIIAVSFKDVLNPKLGLTMRQQGLGRLDWLKEDEEKPKKEEKEGKEHKESKEKEHKEKKDKK